MERCSLESTHARKERSEPLADQARQRLQRRIRAIPLTPAEQVSDTDLMALSFIPSGKADEPISIEEAAATALPHLRAENAARVPAAVAAERR
jgi:hypothetical protein